MFIHGKLVILILALTADGQVHADEIFGGHEAVPHSRPYMVILERHKQDGRTSYCGGFLLNEDFVMTAAHCQASNYTVLLGVHDIREHDNERQRTHVEEAFPHKDYVATTYDNDIMLLKLSPKANFSKHVKPIALADQNDSVPKSCLVSGWGATEESNSMSHTLIEVNLTLNDTENCPKKHSYCYKGESGPRPGDSGGPLVCENKKAYGVVSGGSQKSGVMIHVFTKIPDYTDWISSTIGR